MLHIWRTRSSGKQEYVGGFFDMDAVENFIYDVAIDLGHLKVVKRVVSHGIQFIIKSHATTYEALAAATVYDVSASKEAPAIKTLDISVGKEKVEPGRGLPRSARSKVH